MVTRYHLTYSSVLVLQALARGYRYGFDVMEATGLPSGTVYPALRRLEKLRYISGSWEEQARANRAKRPRRRYYRVTKSGENALEQAVQRFRVLQEPLVEASESREGRRAEAELN